MSIYHYLNKSIIIKRLKSKGGNKRGFNSTATIDAQIQRIYDIDTAQIYGVNIATHKAWVDISEDIKEGDIAVDAEERQYDIVGVINRGEDYAMNEHKELILALYNPNKASP